MGTREDSSETSTLLDGNRSHPDLTRLERRPQPLEHRNWRGHTLHLSSSSEVPTSKGRGFTYLPMAMSPTTCLTNVKWILGLKKFFLLGLLYWNRSLELLVAILLLWRENLLENKAKPEDKGAVRKCCQSHFSTWIQLYLKETLVFFSY